MSEKELNDWRMLISAGTVRLTVLHLELGPGAFSDETD